MHEPPTCEWITLADDGIRPYSEMPWHSGSEPWNGVKPRAIVSLERAGDMAVDKRAVEPWRSRLCSEAGIDETRVRAVRQVHSRTVILVDSQPPEALVQLSADGMVSARAECVLTVTVADCLPIFLADTRGPGFGLVHSGWKGTGIVADAIRLMVTSLGARADRLTAAIGPGIGLCCYTVPRERFDGFRERFGESAVSRDSEGGFRIDLKAANIELLRREGVEAISIAKDCTSCSPHLGSFRRQGASGFTRMLACIGRF